MNYESMIDTRIPVECQNAAHDEPLKSVLLPDATQHQVGGDHYTSMAIQPFEYIQRNCIGFAEGNVIKYVSRWRNKNGIEDLRKAKHTLELLIAFEEAELAKGENA